MTAFIKEICVGTPADSKPIRLSIAFPQSDSSNMITVIAGRNRTGKSHILRNINKCLLSHNTTFRKSAQKTIPAYTQPQSNVSLLLSRDNEIAGQPLLITDMDYLMKKSTTPPLQNLAKNAGSQLDLIETRVRNAFLKFMSDELSARVDALGVEFDKDLWLKDDSFRNNIINTLHPSKRYKCLSSAIVSIFEAATRCGLYFVLSDNRVRLFLRDSSSHVIPMSEWSLGQRSLFIYLILIFYSEFDILLIDEMENHLHPEYISILCDFIKKTSRQTIIITHNPHLIFSRLVDRVWYLEVIDNGEKHPDSEEHEDGVAKECFSSLKRTAINLEKDVDKIAKSYNLFDRLDNQLLRLSQATLIHLDDELTSILKEIFEVGIVSVSSRAHPDIQNDKLADFIIQKVTLKPEGIRVLDFGAGKGRTFGETSKRYIPKINGKHRWDLWEPNPTARAELAKTVAKTSQEHASVSILNSLSDIQEAGYDIVIIANVLHECNARIFSEIVETTRKAVKADGDIIVIEMFPLLTPERYAVSYTSEELRKIFWEAGFAVDSHSLNIRNGSVSAYWLSARVKPNNTPAKSTQDCITGVWNNIMERCCIDYNGKTVFHSPEQAVRIVNDLTTVTSIQSFYFGCWD